MRGLGEDHGAEPPDAVAFGAYDHLVATSWRPSIDPA